MRSVRVACIAVVLMVGIVEVSNGQTRPTASATLAEAAKAIGAETATTLEYAGDGWAATFGQAKNAFTPWTVYRLDAYQMNLDFIHGGAREEMYRTQLDGNVPFDGTRSIRAVNSSHGWDIDGNNEVISTASQTAAERRLRLVLISPIGFLRAATKASKPTLAMQDGTSVITFTATDGHLVTGFINPQHLVERIEATVSDSLLGETLVRVDFDRYQLFGSVRYPAHIVEHKGGAMVLDLTLTAATGPGATRLDGLDRTIAIDTPPELTEHATQEKVVSQSLGKGLWYLTGGTMHSVLVEFKDYLAVIEGPESVERANMVLSEAHRLVAGKPVKFVINTHQHFDSAGGLRAFVTAGATVVTPLSNKSYFERLWGGARETAGAKVQSVVEGVEGKKVITDGEQTLQLYLLQASPHSDAILCAYLPAAKLLVESHVFTTDVATPGMVPAARNLADNVVRLKLDVSRIVPLQGSGTSTVAELQKLAAR